MAADAAKRLKERMDAAKEAEIAAYIMRDIDLRQQNAQEQGVLAYGRKPVPRGRPNERFLQNTLKNIGFANRKQAEDEMWEQWNSQKRQQQGASGSGRGRSPDRSSRGGRQRSPADGHRHSRPSSAEQYSSGGSSDSGGSMDGDACACAAEQEEAFQGMLATKAVRGRGSIGPRADETGPFIFPTDEQERQEYELLRHTQPVAKGAECPLWLRQQQAASPPAREAGGGGAEAGSAPKAKRKRKEKRERKEKKKAKKAKKEKKRRRRSPPSP